jgi:hypothetical protein
MAAGVLRIGSPPRAVKTRPSPADLIRVANDVHPPARSAQLDAAASQGEALIHAARFVGDEEDLYFWRLRRAEWSSQLPPQVALAGGGLSSLESSELSIAQELSRDLNLITDVIASLISPRQLARAHQGGLQSALICSE